MNYREDTLTDIMINDRDKLDNNQTTTPTTSTNNYEKNSYVNPTANQTSPNINITSNIASNTTSRPATLPINAISSPFGPPGSTLSDGNINLSTMVKSSTTGDLNQTGLVASLAPNKNTPLDSIKEWSTSTYKCTRQLINERLGKAQRSVDLILEPEIERLKDTQKRYQNILRIAQNMSNIYSNLIAQQQLLHENLNELAIKENKGDQELQNGNSDQLSLTCDFKQNASMLKNLIKNGEKLILALSFFCSNLHTLVNKTIEDTMITIRLYENARLEYDAEKSSVANLLPAQAACTNTEKLISSKAKYEKLKNDVTIKLKFLDENKTKVMHKQLILFHNAFSSFAAGNANQLESTLKQFSIKATHQPSFLEK